MNNNPIKNILFNKDKRVVVDMVTFYVRKYLLKYSINIYFIFMDGVSSVSAMQQKKSCNPHDWLIR